MVHRRLPKTALLAVALMSIPLGCRSVQRAGPSAEVNESSRMGVHYVEVVSNDVDALTKLYQHVYGFSFGPPEPELGQARVARTPSGMLVGIRKPLSPNEQPTIRTYLAVDDIQRAVKAAEKNGATLAYPPTRQGHWGTFAIVIQGGVQHGLWQP